ncbi:TPA: glycoside hydrolase family protein [Klebsiella pneumoniae]|nr:glycoside hydrolase family protein [Klebsiella pneumoniae]HCB2180230.1 glycoside hydrolase family protein [Klebsiella pneumoniae]HCB3423902.1 glycoside hydrolase family protein [Klebsiella pneumoniae]HCB3516488.1 glycoside hydrolase family protein [Klebsiella pneumoniae]HCM6497755.1 glycoside hydrolase family protein [Klebsiella pneumoniae]
MDLKNRLISYEGSIAYQTKVGYFKNGKFWTYKDSLGYPTIGYGRLLKPGESYPNGITPEQAERMLEEDISTAKSAVRSLGLDLPSDWQDFMTIMVFQLGLSGTFKFRKMIQALRDKNYKEAIVQAKDSLWYKQTKSRVDQMIAELTNK